jgi:hypothetical protein
MLWRGALYMENEKPRRREMENVRMMSKEKFKYLIFLSFLFFSRMRSIVHFRSQNINKIFEIKSSLEYIPLYL